jgi:hypothetical protein
MKLNIMIAMKIEKHILSMDGPMFKISAVLLVCFWISLSSLYASEKVFTVEHSREVSDSESKNDARRICFRYAKQKLLTEAVEFLMKEKSEEMEAFTRKDIEQFCAVLIEVKTKSEKWEYADNRFSLHMVVESIVDPDVLEKRISSFYQDDALKKKIGKDQDQLKILENNYLALEKQLASAKEEKVVPLRKERQIIFSEIEQIEKIQYEISSKTKLVSENISTGMTVEELITIAGQPRSTATCEKPDFLNYGDIWVWIDNGIVIGKIPVDNWSGPCYHYAPADKGAISDNKAKASENEDKNEKLNYSIVLKTGQTINTSSYYKVDDVIYYKKYGGIIGIEEEKVETIKEIK